MRSPRAGPSRSEQSARSISVPRRRTPAQHLRRKGEAGEGARFPNSEAWGRNMSAVRSQRAAVAVLALVLDPAAARDEALSLTLTNEKVACSGVALQPARNSRTINVLSVPRRFQFFICNSLRTAPLFPLTARGNKVSSANPVTDTRPIRFTSREK